MRRAILIASTMILTAPAAAYASECAPEFVSGDQTVTINGVDIEPFGVAKEDFHVRVRNGSGSTGDDMGRPESSPPCPATIRISRISTPDPDFPSYTLRAPGNQAIEVLPDESTGGSSDSDIDIANAPPGPQGRNIPFHIAIATEWGLRAGTYVEKLQLSLFDDAGNITDRSTLTITIIIPAAVSIRIVGAVGRGGGGPARVDLGELSKTEETRSDPFGARIFSTAPHVVSFVSANLGNLLHENARDQIPYRLRFDGTLVNLAGANEFVYPFHTPQAGVMRPLDITVPPVVAPAGRYSDRVTVSVTAM